MGMEAAEAIIGEDQGLDLYDALVRSREDQHGKQSKVGGNR